MSFNFKACDWLIIATPVVLGALLVGALILAWIMSIEF